MPTTVANIQAKISVDGADKAQKDLKGVNDEVEKSPSKWGAATKAVHGFIGGLSAGVGFAAAQIGIASIGDAFHTVTDAITGTISAAADSQKVMAATNAVLASTHGI